MTGVASEAWPFKPPVLQAYEFRRLRELVRQHFGIHLSDEKHGQVSDRMGHYLSQRGVSTYSEFLDRVESDQRGEQLDELASLISTNHTYFFRDQRQLDLLRTQVWPDLEAEMRQTGNPDLRVWCAASSTGEEAYSILFTMLAYFGERYPSYSAGVLATDISTTALAHAERGIYDDDRAAAVPPGMRAWFMKRRADGRLQVRREIRKEVHFKKLNLMQPVFPFQRPFQVIFCRNVMIYFDEASRAGLCRRLATCLAPGGLLFLGAAETIQGEPSLEYVSPSIYRRRRGV